MTYTRHENSDYPKNALLTLYTRNDEQLKEKILRRPALRFNKQKEAAGRSTRTRGPAPKTAGKKAKGTRPKGEFVVEPVSRRYLDGS
jgi:hypothetical protein